MNAIQTDVSDASLITAIRLNLCELFRHSSKNHPEEHFENEGLTRWHTPLAYPWFNGVLCTRPSTKADGQFIQETIEYFRDKKVRLFTWWVQPPLEAESWKPVLSRYGFGFSDSTPGMAIDLEAMKEAQPPMKDFEIRIAGDDFSMRVWANVFVTGYGFPPDWEDPWLEVWKKMGLDFPVRSYVGYLNGEPVATSSVFFGAGAAGIYCVATLLEARGKGIGAAMTIHPLQEARADGYRIGILQSSEMGFPVYKRLGFRHLCAIENFYLKLDS